jgi:hypothetical protein
MVIVFSVGLHCSSTEFDAASWKLFEFSQQRLCRRANPRQGGGFRFSPSPMLRERKINHAG